MKIAMIHLPYYKQGDDLSACLEQTNSVEEALMLHASTLEEASKQLKQISKLVKGKRIHIEADTHHISIDADEEVLTDLDEAGLIWFDEFEEEDEDQDCDLELDDE
jgi:predicted RNase H-like HicB family nuclease